MHTLKHVWNVHREQKESKGHKERNAFVKLDVGVGGTEAKQKIF